MRPVLAGIVVSFFAISETQTVQAAAGNGGIIAVAAATLAVAALVGVLVFRFWKVPAEP